MQKDRKKTILQLDKKASIECRKLKPRCLFCKSRAIEPHHAIHRRNNIKYRWSQENLISLCRFHHSQVHSGEISYNEVRREMLYWDVISIEDLDRIEQDNSINKITTAELKELL